MKRLPIRRLAKADEDLIDIWFSVAYDNRTAANRLFDRIVDRCQQLATLPYSGVSSASLSEGLRYLVCGNYLIFYRVMPNEIVIVRVLDGRRDITSDDFAT